MGRRLGGGHPPRGFLHGSVFRNRVAKKLVLVLRGPPAAVDEELDAVVRGIRCSLAQDAEERRVEVGYTRGRVVEDRRAGGHGTGRLAERTTLLTTRATVRTGKDVEP